MLNGVIQDRCVRRIARKYLTQKGDAMSEVAQQMTQVVGNVVIEQEGHESEEDI